MTTQNHEVWAYGASSGLTRAQLSAGATPSGGAWVSLGPPADSALPAVQAAGSNLHRALLGLWMQLEQEAQERWLLLLTEEFAAQASAFRPGLAAPSVRFPLLLDVLSDDL